MEPSFDDRFDNNLPDYVNLTPVDYDPFGRAAQRTRAHYDKANQRTSGLPDVLNVIGNKVQSGLTAPLDALTGQLQVNDPETNMPTREAMGRAMDVAGLAGSGGISGAEGGAVLGSGPIKQGWEFAGLKEKPASWDRVKPAIRDPETGELFVGSRRDTHEHVLARQYEKETGEISGEDRESLNKLYEWDKKKNFEDGYYDFKEQKFHNRSDPNSEYYGVDSTSFNPRKAMRSDQVWSDTQKPGMIMSSIMNENKATPFYSALEHAVENTKQQKMPADQWLGTISNSKGVKPEELDWTGFKDFLAEKGKQPVTKAEVQEHLNSNKVELNEVNKGAQEPEHFSVYNEEDENWDIHDKNGNVVDGGYQNERAAQREILRLAGHEQHISGNAELNDGTKYSQYQLPGGENYREMLMTMPDNKFNNWYNKSWNPRGDTPFESLPQYTKNDVLKSYKEDTGVDLPQSYKSSHWDEPNILAHVRMNDRNIEGKKSLHLEEIQSDWHQQGREKGYKTGDPEFDEEFRQSGVPDAPFKKSWHELVLKRMIREAAEKGYDRLSWTPGEAQAARYDLSKSVDTIQATKNKNGTYDVHYRPINDAGFQEMGKGITQQKLADNVGKELAEKISKQEKETQSYKGLDLKVGGEGMKGFYDQIIPKAIEKIGKEHGVKVKTAEIETNPKGWKITPPSETVSGKWMVKSNDYNSKGFHFNTKEEAEANLKQQIEDERTPKQKLHYIDIPESLKNVATQKGFPLFSSGLPFSFIPIDGDPFEKKK